MRYKLRGGLQWSSAEVLLQLMETPVYPLHQFLFWHHDGMAEGPSCTKGVCSGTMG